MSTLHDIQLQDYPCLSVNNLESSNLGKSHTHTRLSKFS